MNVPDEIREQIREKIRRPRGTLTFNYTSRDLFNPEIAGGRLFEITSGSHLFRIERDDKMTLSFYHSSPGTGTRVASIDLNEVKPAKTLFMAFTWGPSGITLNIGPRIEGGELHRVEGEPSEKQYRVGLDGSVYELGNKGVHVMGARIYRGGKAVITPTALEAWKEVLHGVEVLNEIDTDENYLREVVISNSILMMLVTGLENYGKKRFVELEREGIRPNHDGLIGSIFSNRQIKNNLPDFLREEAAEQGITFIDYLVSDRRINFQNYNQTKRVYKATYDIRFGDIEVSSQDLERLQILITYRHKIVHISPLITMLNQEELASKEPEFSNKELATDSIHLFKEFIDGFHKLTLTLDRED